MSPWVEQLRDWREGCSSPPQSSSRFPSCGQLPVATDQTAWRRKQELQGNLLQGGMHAAPHINPVLSMPGSLKHKPQM